MTEFCPKHLRETHSSSLKQSCETLLLSKLITLLNDAGHCDHQHSLLFYATFTVRYKTFLLHCLTQKHFFGQIKLMTTPMKGTVPYASKAVSLIFVHASDTGRSAENTEHGRCVRAVWNNLKSRLLITDLSNNRSFGREGYLNRVSFDFIRRT